MNKLHIIIEKEDGTMKSLKHINYREDKVEEFKKLMPIILKCAILCIIIVPIPATMLKGYILKDYTDFTFALLISFLEIILVITALVYIKIKNIFKIKKQI